MTPPFEYHLQQTRRQFFGSVVLSRGGLSLGMCDNGRSNKTTSPPGSSS